MGEIHSVHDGNLRLGHVNLPFTIKQDSNNTIVIEFGSLVDGKVFAIVELWLMEDGTLEVDATAAQKGLAEPLSVQGKLGNVLQR